MSTANGTIIGPPCDLAEIKRWLSLVIPPDQTLEIRVFLKPDGATSRTCRGNALAAVTAFAQLHSGRAAGVYYTVNPVRPTLRSGSAACDTDIIGRRLLFIDSDPIRPADTSATEAEKARARAQADSIRAFLRARGWPEGALVD